MNIENKNMSATIAKLFAHEMAISVALSIAAANNPKGRELLDAFQKGLMETEITDAPPEFVSVVRNSILDIFKKAKDRLG
jgi:hypothetical protein